MQNWPTKNSLIAKQILHVLSMKENIPITDPYFLEVYIEGLRKAGVPEC